MSELEKIIDTVTITKLDNGYYVHSKTIRGSAAHYCSNLRGVTKQLYWLLEEKKRLSKDQVEGVRGAFKQVKETLEHRKQEENDDA